MAPIFLAKVQKIHALDIEVSLLVLLREGTSLFAEKACVGMFSDWIDSS